MVHFVRFDGARRKIPHEIGGSTTLRFGDHVYALTGVLVHTGPSATSGHYYCDVVCPPHEQTGLAYRCNDAEYPSLIEEELGPDYMAAYMHIYELETGSEAAPAINTLESDTRKRKSGEKLTVTAATATEKQQRRSGLQANEEGQGLPAAGDEQQRGRGLPASEEEERRRLKSWVEEDERIRSIATAERSKEEKRGLKWMQKKINEVKENHPEEQGLQATSDEQQRGRGLQANNQEGNGTPIGNGTGSIATNSEQQRRGGLQANEEEQRLLATNMEQQRGRGLPASEETRNGKLIGNCRGSIPSTVESCTEEDEGRRRLEGWVEEKRKIHSKKPAERSKEEERRAACLTKNIKKAKDNYPDVDTSMPSKAKTGAERNKILRGGKGEEELQISEETPQKRTTPKKIVEEGSVLQEQGEEELQISKEGPLDTSDGSKEAIIPLFRSYENGIQGRLKQWLAERDEILAILPPKLRSKGEKKKLKWLERKVRELDPDKLQQGGGADDRVKSKPRVVDKSDGISESGEGSKCSPISKTAGCAGENSDVEVTLLNNIICFAMLVQTSCDCTGWQP